MKETSVLEEPQVIECIRAVACYFHDKDDRMLIGKKAKGFGEGFIMPPGGKYEPEDEDNALLAAGREGREETKLEVVSAQKVARINVHIFDKKQRLEIDAVRITAWTGTLRHNDEFAWMAFAQISHVLAMNILPHEADWMKLVFIRGKPSLVDIWCGRDRTDVTGIRIVPLDV